MSSALDDDASARLYVAVRQHEPCWMRSGRVACSCDHRARPLHHHAEHMAEALRELLAEAWSEGEDASDEWHRKNDCYRYGDERVAEPVNPYRVIPPVGESND